MAMRLIDSYKSIWVEDDDGCYSRFQKSFYPLQFLVPPFLAELPLFNRLFSLIGRKAQGADYYRYYSRVISRHLSSSSTFYGKWASEYSDISSHFLQAGVDFNTFSFRACDVSGEPGFFAKTVTHNHQGFVDVSCFADSVVPSLESLGLNAFKYDFNCDNLLSRYRPSSLNIIFARYCIGFCVDLESFVSQVKDALEPGGYMYLAFHPSSRAVIARWMFDDYTYLRQYTEDYVLSACQRHGFSLVSRIDLGAVRWDEGRSFIQRRLSAPYLDSIFNTSTESDLYQSRVSLIFKKS